ncbi:DAK2 domain-containing protein [Dethiothermospora halolimnae]|uniref:DAK2 domain-containing protein n=1 Tax=Dethiothermospora halolimnae TaxID=3114390 RepID=UPI003CCBE04A
MLKIEYIDSILLRKAILGAANSLEMNKEIINDLNVFPVPDGDTGTNMSLTMQSAVKHIKSIEKDSITEIANGLSYGSLMGARGNSGVILSQIFRGFSKGLEGLDSLTTEDLANAFKLGAETAYKAANKPIEGTILTVARECAEKANEIFKHEKDILKFAKVVIEHGDKVLQKTPEMLEALKKAGVVDAGGKGLMVILKGAFEVLSGNHSIISEDNISLENKKEIKSSPQIDEKDIKFGYCTEFIINKTNAELSKVRKEVSKYGDSLLVVGGDDVIKVHVHTNDPGNVLQYALSKGELIDIKIDNMRYQHRSNVIKEKAAEDNREQMKYGFISVAMGDGIASVFEELNVNHVISGGQTMNPSTEDIMKAIDNINAENIIILPNNKNIILAATQAKELSDKNIKVLPTRTIAQGISSILAFDEELDLDDNIENMKEAMNSVKTGQVTYAVRDTELDDKKIKKDDIMGLDDGNIVSVGEDIEMVSLDLIEKMVTDEDELITIFYGEDIKETDAEKLGHKIEEELEDFDVEIVYGGQPLYYYIFSVE